MNANRTDLLLLVTLASNNADSKGYGLTITEIMENITATGCTKTRMTVYRRMKRLLADGYVVKGILSDHADTFCISGKGKELLEVAERKVQ